MVGFLVARASVATPASLTRYYFIGLNFLYSLASLLLIITPGKGKSIVYEHDRKIIGPDIFVIMLLQCAPLLFYTSQFYLAILFIFTFFAGNTFLPIYLNYGTLFSVFPRETDKRILPLRISVKNLKSHHAKLI